MTIKVCNAFSLNMLATSAADISIQETTAADAAYLIYKNGGVESCVGHADTAKIFGQQLLTEIPVARVTVQFTHDEFIVVGQYTGPRLPEGATALPEGASIKWYVVYVNVPETDEEITLD
jgi:hypothetical protein